MAQPDTINLLEVKDLRVYFHSEDGTVKAVDGISFDLKQGETLGIVGESGSGKTVANLSLMRLIPEPPGEILSGSVVLGGRDVLKFSATELRDLRGKQMAMIFQDPMTALNPFMRVSKQLMEVTQLHLGHTKVQAREHAIKMLENVGIPDAPERVDSYPHEFSGGMRQRVMIAMALSCRPELLIADEPTTALDVTIQAQILRLLGSLRERHGTAIVLITHDLGVVAQVCDRVGVMYAGQLVEIASVDELFTAPRHPYTRALLAALPATGQSPGSLRVIEGAVPDLSAPPPGCRFAPRCPHRMPECQVVPPLALGPSGQQIACWLDPLTRAAAERSQTASPGDQLPTGGRP